MTAITDWFIGIAYTLAGLLAGLNYDKRPARTGREAHERI